jgi:hypothetical protein
MSGDRIRRPRVILNDDGSNFLYAWDDLGVADLRTYLARLADTHVDMVAWCVAFGGYVCYYESEVAEAVGSGFGFSDRVSQRRWAHNRERLRREAGDYVGAVFAVLREMGIPALASFRMNDAHMSSDPTGPVAGRFWMNHPQWRLGEPYGYYGSCLDYAVPAVRAYLRRLVQEVVAKFPDIAGIELDGLRSPFFFKPDKGREQAPLMTELVRQIRNDLAAASGRERYLLHVNVPRTPDLALECGMDVAAWDAEGLVDSIAPGCYNTDFQPPTEQWRALLGDRVTVYPYLNCSPATAQYHSLEQYRAAADNAYASGADGIYLFNFPCLDELSSLLPRPLDAAPFPPPPFHAQGWHPDLERARQALAELGDPQAVAAGDRHYLFYWATAPYRHYTPHPPRLDRLAPEPAELTFRCHHVADAARIELKVKTVGVTIRDAFAFELNGQPIDASRTRRLHAPGGRDARVHGVRLGPYSQFVFELRPDDLTAGENRLRVALAEREPDLFGPIELAELELLVGQA